MDFDVDVVVVVVVKQIKQVKQVKQVKQSHSSEPTKVTANCATGSSQLARPNGSRRRNDTQDRKVSSKPPGLSSLPGGEQRDSRRSKWPVVESAKIRA